MLAKAKEAWEQDQVDKEGEKERYLAERITPLRTSGLSFSQLQVRSSGDLRGGLTTAQESTLFFMAETGPLQSLMNGSLFAGSRGFGIHWGGW